MAHDAYIGLGSNLGDREDTVRRAIALLRPARTSRLHETDPVGFLDQPRFVNAAAHLETDLPPRGVLDRLLEIERELGRTRDGPRFGPRTIDLDLLLYDDVVLAEPGLTIPHPRMHERRFVLEPLAEIAPALVVPGHGPILQLLAGLD